MQVASNSWYHLTSEQWAVMGLCLVIGLVVSYVVERAGRPRRNKWSDWRNL